MRRNRIQSRALFSAVLFLIVMATLQAGPALAVRPGEVSWTAQAVTAFRAIGAQHPDPTLRNPDDLAERFLSDVFWEDFFYPKEFAEARQRINVYGSPGYFYVQARTLHMDAVLKQALAGGTTQVVILGAGFDSRAYRFGKTHASVKFFEVDLPATIADKQQRIIEIFGSVPANVTYAPIDFLTQTIPDVLNRLGYDSSRKTFVVWEGVSMYLNEAAVGATFNFLRHHAPSGSAMVFDYILSAVIEGKFDGLHGAARSARSVAKRGEPYSFGMTPERCAAVVKQHGLVLESNLGHRPLTERYLTRPDGRADGVMGNFYQIAVVQVP